MGEEDQGNLDSFVDIIANTAGIMIVLVVMSLINSNQAGSVANVKLVELSRLRSEESDLQKEMPDKATKTLVKKEHEEARDTLEQGLKELNLEGADSADIREKVEKADKQKAVRREDLDKITTEEQEAMRDQKEASRETGVLVTPEQLEFLRDKNIVDMQGDRDRTIAETVALKEKSKGLAGDKTGLEGEVATLEKEVEVLAAQGGATLEVGGPMAKMARERQAVWAECFRPKESLDTDGVPRPCVRLVSVEGFGKKEKDKDDRDVLRVDASGESTFQIIEENSKFQEFLAGKTDEQKEKLYLVFVVRPDAYSAFRLARKIATGYGWKVYWRPIEAGKTIAFPGTRNGLAQQAMPPATTSRGTAAADERG